ncbi:MAG: hypothetical protein HY904_14270 [Deltaproteobacteria bacterium]|nr:hypothetical protein [Deltaproteobacteria bacterium]
MARCTHPGMRGQARRVVMGTLVAVAAACTPAGQQGRLRWEWTGGNALEGGAGAESFVDGWSVHFTRYLVAVDGLVFNNEAGTEQARLAGARVVDLVRPGPHLLAELEVTPATWTSVGFSVRPVTAGAQPVDASEDDVAELLRGGLAVLAEGTLTGGGRTLAFSWGFRPALHHAACVTHARVEAGGQATVRMVFHGERLFLESLASGMLRLRAQAQVDADTGDGRVTVEELAAVSGDAFTALEWPRADAQPVTSLLEFEEAALVHAARVAPDGACHVTLVSALRDGGL